MHSRFHEEGFRPRRGFTLVEMLVVIAVIVALAATAIPLLSSQRTRHQIASTEVLLRAVSSAIEGYGSSSFTWVTGSPPQQQFHSRALWDLDRDGLLDGDPEHLPGSFPPGYAGFVAMAQPQLGAADVDEQRQVVDPWGRVLRIAHASRAYAGADFGIWSLGPDPDATSDDLTSWTLAP